ncbi:hypothetical protein FHX82_005996 [Amycolatopsis bartoniae]|uniref:Uncharacterized protein n=1 Tax=Amycolatopsis bartoniae TaxID=941986 RepID=A0A8H9IVJ7_9PSEU|nr:hypothetical protein [Amycolatopsis bartoniae]MBB2938910.1 hypothetical protein [Amycolatopsis bartoniae]TVT11276.1 hypothetical protein FNH07_02425 [Amycolatopsis bartoniae]GHF66216.1 hypothetical protein GCM10017566_44970 [Amycolatopsis bartoniae]
MELGRVLAAVTGEAAAAADGVERKLFDASGAEAFLAVPFVRLSRQSGERSLVSGQARVLSAAGAPEVTVAVRAVWAETGGWHLESGSDGHVVALEVPPPDEADPRAAVVQVAKAIAESSRNEIAHVRGLRYELERQLAELLAKRRHGTLRPLLAQLVELSTALGRVRDQAQEAVRDGMWIWLWDEDAYRGGNGAAWTTTYRAGLRHCEVIDQQLAEEISRLHSLLSSMSAFAVAQDSEAQDRFNLMAAVVAAGLGLPALILSLYGADSYLPLSSFDHAWRALLPIAVTVGVATTAAVRFLPGLSRGRHYAAALAVAAVLVGILWFAGALAVRG